MNIKDIKVGETYNVRVKVKYIDGYDVVAATIGQDEKECYRTRFLSADLPAFSPISPETASKYDPCRKFRKGDKVSPCSWHDRPPMASEYCGNIAFVLEDGVYKVKDDERNPFVLIDYHGKAVFVSACNLELVTPVEEPYSVSENIHGWVVFKDTPGNVVANFNNTHPNAKAAAEAECARLNAEWRKEQE